MRFTSLLVSFAVVGCGLETSGKLAAGAGDGAVDASTKFQDAVAPADATSDDDASIPDASAPEVKPVVDAAVVDANPPDPGIACNGAFCNPSLEVCCIKVSSTSCTAKGSCNGGVPLGCDGKNDCQGGQVCCGNLSVGVVCKSSCTAGEVRICVPSAQECTCTGSVGSYNFCL